MTTGARHECSAFTDRVSLQLNRFNFKVKEWIADKGYGRGPTYRYLKEQKIRAYIPLHDDNLGEGKLSRRGFIYERKQDRYRCPEGHYLYPYDKIEGCSTKRYRITGGHCQRCPLENQCLPDNYTNRTRFVYRGLYQDGIDHVKRRQSTSHFRLKLVERKWKIEGLFAEANGCHGLERAKYRGLTKVQIQCYLIAIVQNFKRLINYVIYFLILRAFVREIIYLG